MQQEQQQPAAGYRTRSRRRSARLVAAVVVAAVGLGGIVMGSSAKAVIGTGPSPLAGHRIRIGDMTVSEGDAATFTVSVTPAPARIGVSSVNVRAATVDGSTTGGDYTPITTQLTFGPGESTKQLTVQTSEDALLEQNETFFVLLSNATRTCTPTLKRCDGVTIVDDRGVGTINDDDAPVPPPPAPPSVAISDATRATRTTDCALIVALDRTSTDPASVQYNATGSVDQLAGPTSGTLTFAPGTTTQSIVLDVVRLKRRSGLVTVTLSSPTGLIIGDTFGTCAIKAKRR